MTWNKTLSVKKHGILAFAFVCLFATTGCTTTQAEEESSVSVTSMEIQTYEPITRLAFVQNGEKQNQIAVVRDTTVQRVSEIETAAGNQTEEIIEH